VYDMYHWDQPQAPGTPGLPGQAMLTGAKHRGRPAGGAGQPRPPATGVPRPRLPENPAGPAAQAVQVALDRRDNGGDPRAPRGQ
jgi:hypothetical protein